MNLIIISNYVSLYFTLMQKYLDNELMQQIVIWAMRGPKESFQAMAHIITILQGSILVLNALFKLKE